MNTSIEEKIKQSKTSLFRVVFPELTNHHNTMLGGKILEIMDEIAFITATRFSRKRFVVAGSEVDYKKPIPAGDLIEVIGEVSLVGKTSLTISVKVFTEDMYSKKREEAVTSSFTCVSIDENKMSTPI